MHVTDPHNLLQLQYTNKKYDRGGKILQTVLVTNNLARSKVVTTPIRSKPNIRYVTS